MNNRTPTDDYDSAFTYGGISGVKISDDSFPMGEGIELRKTYSHLFSANMMAFARPGPQGYHPSPWRAAKGGFSYDIEVEIRAPKQTSLGASFDAKEIIWLIGSLLRLANFPYLSVPVISSHSFNDILNSDQKPTLTPLETDSRIFGSKTGEAVLMENEHVAWVASKWRDTGRLLSQNPKFYSAFKAFDLAGEQGRTSASMLALWGGIEQLFAPSAGELRFRVAALLSSYLEEPGSARLELYKKILKLYNERSMAAHTAHETEIEPLVQTYILMRNALVRIIGSGVIPTQADLESLLFCSPE
jgi:hypothetical protein